MMEGAIMGIWAKLFGRHSNPLPPTLQRPSHAAPFHDRPPVRRILYYLQHAVLRDSALMSHARMAEVIATGRISEEHARDFWDPCVCEWTASGGHVNDQDELEPDLEAFAARILTRAQS
jgi:hypothetical protein